MTATIIKFPARRPDDLLRRMDALNRDCLCVYEATIFLLVAAIELQMELMGLQNKK